MNIIKFMGGLGNQMFQFALYDYYACNGLNVIANIDYYYENESAMPFVLPMVFPKLKILYDEYKIFNTRKKWYLRLKTIPGFIYVNYHYPQIAFYYNEDEGGKYDRRVQKITHAAISGFWQSEKYFENNKNHIKQLFKFAYGEEKLQKIANSVCVNYNSVSVHIRRGDYLEKEEIYGGICTKEYYQKAIEYISKKIKEPIFIFFSNDIMWVKKNFQINRACYIEMGMFESYADWYDMYLMSLCHHNIIANSTFSWWGAWLNSNPDKIVIAPKRWFLHRDTPDIYPTEWFLIDSI